MLLSFRIAAICNFAIADDCPMLVPNLIQFSPFIRENECGEDLWKIAKLRCKKITQEAIGAITFRLGERCIGPPNFLSVVFKKQEISQHVFTRMQDLAYEFSKKIWGDTPGPSQREGDATSRIQHPARPLARRGAPAPRCWNPNLGPRQLFSRGCARARSSAAVEITRVGGHHAVQGHLRSVMLIGYQPKARRKNVSVDNPPKASKLAACCSLGERPIVSHSAPI